MLAFRFLGLLIASRRKIVVSCTIGLALATAGLPAAADEQAARETLAAAGLVPVGKRWLCREEVELRNQLDQLGRLERNFFPARDKYTELIKKYQDYRGRLEKLQAALDKNQELLSQSPGVSLQRQQLESQSQQYSDAIRKIRKEIDKQLNVLDERSPVTEAAVQMVNARNALAVALLSIDRLTDQVERRSAELSRDAGIAAAIASLEGQSLGPAEDYGTTYRRMLSRLKAVAFTEGVPVYRRSGQFRLSLIVAEQTPATFSYMGPVGPTLVPASLLQSADIPLDPSAAGEVLEEEGRRIVARRVKIPALRVGKIVLRNVDALALPPEAEDLGARLSMEAFGGYHAELEPTRLWFRLVDPP